MRLPVVVPISTKDGTSNKNARLTNMLKETSKRGDKAVVRPGLVAAGDFPGIGNGLIPFDGRLLVISDDTITDESGDLWPWPLDSLPWVSGTTYGAGDSAWYNGVLWFSLAAGNTGHTPVVGAYWGTSSPYITPATFSIVATLTAYYSAQPASGAYGYLNQPLMIGSVLVVPDWTGNGWDGQQTTDGITWSTYGHQNLGYPLAYVVGSTIFAVDSQDVYSSTNTGSTWTTHSSAITISGLSRVAAHGGTLYAINHDGSPPIEVSTSTDGITWSAPTSTSGLPYNEYNLMSFGGSLVAIPTNGGTMKSSSDGVTWATVGSGFPTGGNYGYGIIGSRLYVAGGSAGNVAKVYSTLDLTTWTTETFADGSGWTSDNVGPVIAELGGKVTFVQYNGSGGTSVEVWQ